MRLFVLLLIFISGIVQAYGNPADSLQVLLAQAKTDSARVELHCQLSKQLFLTDPKQGREYAFKAEALARKSGYRRGQAQSLSLIGHAHLVDGAYLSGLQIHLKALQLYQQLQDTAGLITSYNGLGIMYHKMDDLVRSEQYFQIAFKLALKAKDEAGLGKTYNSLGNLYESKKEYLKALKYFKQTVALQEKLGDKRSLAVGLLNVGNIYLLLEQPEKALPYLQQSLRVDAEIKNEMNPIATLKSISRTYLAMGDKDKALTYAQEAYERAVKADSHKKKAAAAKLMHEVHAARAEYKSAYNYLLVFEQEQDALDKKRQKEKAAEITAQYETTKKDLENQKLKAGQEKQKLELDHKNTILTVAIGVVLLMMVLLVELFRSKAEIKKTYAKLQEVNLQLQDQHTKISLQRNELAAQAQMLQQQNQELAKHDKFKSKVFSIISHDLRAPFNSIKTILQLLPTNNWAAADIQKIMDLLGKEADISLTMLNNLLIWSKAQLSESKVNLGHVNLHELVQENIELAASLAEVKQLQLVNAVPANTVAFTDKERVNFVLRNLLSNAVKFSFVGGSITFQVKSQDGAIVFTVQDTGNGIPVGNLAKLFTEQRFTTMGTSKERGTGLGLMLCKELIESLQGSITVTSEEGKGSTFICTLPNAAMPVDTQDVTRLSA